MCACDLSTGGASVHARFDFGLHLLVELVDLARELLGRVLHLEMTGVRVHESAINNSSSSPHSRTHLLHLLLSLAATDDLVVDIRLDLFLRDVSC
jgi:hypothetical protein